MNKFNLPQRNLQRQRRQKRSERRRQQQKARPVRESSPTPVEDGSCNSSILALKVSSSSHSGYVSGKRKAKLQKKWRRAQKEALQSGLVTMHDIEMMTTAEEEGTGTDDGSLQLPKPTKKTMKKFSMKKRAKLRSKSSYSQVAVSNAGNAGDGGEDAMMQ